MRAACGPGRVARVAGGRRRWARRTRAQAGAPARGQPALALEELLTHAGAAARVHTAQLVTRDGSYALRGTGTALGEACAWALRWDSLTGTSFAEECHLAALGDLRLRSGHDARSGSGSGSAFQTDLTGGTTVVEPGDDAHTRCVLTTWVRTGQWVHAVQRNVLHAQLDDQDTCSSGGGGSSSSSGSGGRRGAKRRQRGGSAVSVLLSIHGGGAGAGTARLVLDPATWTPAMLEFQVHSGGVETWTWSTWPVAAKHVQSSGQETTYAAPADAPEGAPAGGADDAVPLAQLLQPPRAPHVGLSFPTTTVPAARAGGGQFVLRARALPATADASDSASPHEGWYVLDPCSDGCVISPHVGDAVAWPSAGQQQLHALDGPAAGPLRQGALALGQCVLARHTWHQQLALNFALTIPHGQPLAGVLGMSMLRRCVVEIRAHARVPGSRDAPITEVLVHAPSTFADPSDRVTVSWQRLRFLDGAPHVECTLWLYDDPDGDQGPDPMSPAEMEVPFAGWFRLGLGVGGTALILSASTANQINFAESTQALQPSGVLAGPGAERGRFQAAPEGLLSGRLSRVSLRGASFVRQRAVVHTSRDAGGVPRAVDPEDLQMSGQSAGVLCGDLFRGCTILLDVPGQRCAVLKHAPV